MNKKMITALTVAGLATFAMAENASADTYTVQSGDTLSQIAANHNTTVDTLVANNNIADANVIFVGQQVEIDGVASNASYDATQADVAAVVASQAPVTQQVSYTAPVTTVDYSAQSQAPVAQEVSYTAPVATTTTTAAASGSTYDQSLLVVLQLCGTLSFCLNQVVTLTPFHQTVTVAWVKLSKLGELVQLHNKLLVWLTTLFHVTVQSMVPSNSVWLTVGGKILPNTIDYSNRIWFSTGCDFFVV